VIRMPWSNDDRRFRRPIPAPRVDAISLIVDLPELATQVIAVQAFFGADSIPDSVLNLRPGDRARVRAGGAWTLSVNGQHAKLLDRPSLPVRARLDVYAPEAHYASLRADNTIEVTLSK
jgi:hypothetical protein